MPPGLSRARCRDDNPGYGIERAGYSVHDHLTTACAQKRQDLRAVRDVRRLQVCIHTVQPSPRAGVRPAAGAG
eukprot:SAG25_NODE_7311_length_489_cov_0.520513_2_plen_72_part_01